MSVNFIGNAFHDMYQRLLVILISAAVLAGSAFGITTTSTNHKKRHRVVHAAVTAVKASVTEPPKLLGLRRSKKHAMPPVDPTLGDLVDGEDLMARRAAVQALGLQSGAV